MLCMLLSTELLPLGSAGFKCVMGILLHHPHLVGSVTGAFAIWAAAVATDLQRQKDQMQTSA